MDVNMVIIGGFVGLGLLYVFASLVEAEQLRELKRLQELKSNKQAPATSQS